MCEMKVCVECKRELPVSEFNKRKSAKDGLNYKCKECYRKERKEDYQRNKEKIKARARKYHNENKEEISKKDKERYNNNKQYYIDKAKKWADENQDKVKARNKRYYQENSEKIKAKVKKRYDNDDNKKTARATYNRRVKNNYERHLIMSSNTAHKRRALKLSTEDGSITTDALVELLDSQDCKCNECGCCLVENKKHLDHIKPLSKGGGHTLDNVQYLCEYCNLSKGSKFEE